MIETKSRMNLRRITVCIISSILLLSVSGCGFKLRNYSPELSISHLKQIELHCSKFQSWELCHQLRQKFKQHGIEITDGAEFSLSIAEIKNDIRTLSLQQNASAAEYGLSASVEYQLINTIQSKVIATNVVARSHSYRHESSALLAKERERIEVQTELSQLLADEIFRQVCILNPIQTSSINHSQAESK